VVFDDDAGHIPLYYLKFTFKTRSYTSTDFEYYGSNQLLDLCFFILHASPLLPDYSFSMTSDEVLYKGMKIKVAGFPSVLDIEQLDSPTPKVNSGIVSALGYEDIAVSDVSSTLPNLSGGAVFSARGKGETLLGIHLGTFYHEDESNKVVKLDTSEKENGVVVGTLTDLTKEGVCKTKKRQAKMKSSASSDSPFENTRGRSKYGEENVKHKGSMAYFVTHNGIVRLLAKAALVEAALLMGKSARTNNSKRRKVV
jgi:hypothetical protein